MFWASAIRTPLNTSHGTKVNLGSKFKVSTPWDWCNNWLSTEFWQLSKTAKSRPAFEAHWKCFEKWVKLQEDVDNNKVIEFTIAPWSGDSIKQRAKIRFWVLFALYLRPQACNRFPWHSAGPCWHSKSYPPSALGVNCQFVIHQFQIKNCSCITIYLNGKTFSPKNLFLYRLQQYNSTDSFIFSIFFKNTVCFSKIVVNFFPRIEIKKKKWKKK